MSKHCLNDSSHYEESCSGRVVKQYTIGMSQPIQVKVHSTHRSNVEEFKLLESTMVAAICISRVGGILSLVASCKLRHLQSSTASYGKVGLGCLGT
jgi:S-adenosylmethionine synthetase